MDGAEEEEEGAGEVEEDSTAETEEEVVDSTVADSMEGEEDNITELELGTENSRKLKDTWQEDWLLMWSFCHFIPSPL